MIKVPYVKTCPAELSRVLFARSTFTISVLRISSIPKNTKLYREKEREDFSRDKHALKAKRKNIMIEKKA